jgi:hypothetical protein
MAIGAGTPPSVLLGQLKMTEFLYLGHLRLEAEMPAEVAFITSTPEAATFRTLVRLPRYRLLRRCQNLLLILARPVMRCG